jgi:hypothetical protein
MKLVQQFLLDGFPLEVNVGVGMPVPRQELFQPQRVGGMVRPQQHYISQVVGDEPHTAQNERPHEHVAEVAVDLNQLAKAFAIELEHLAGFARTATHDGAAA